MKQLNEYEKKNLLDLQETFHKIGQDLTELEKDFLEGSCLFVALINFSDRLDKPMF